MDYVRVIDNIINLIDCLEGKLKNEEKYKEKEKEVANISYI